MREKIITHMRKMGEWGEFFSAKISLFAYNETVAQEYFPLVKDEAIARGYHWRDIAKKNYQITIQGEDLPDSIGDSQESVVAQIVGCAHAGTCNEQCTVGFRLLPQEIQFYKNLGIPLPRLCHNCRHYERLRRKNPLKLWARRCCCAGAASENREYKNTAAHFHGTEHCPNEFETSYAPDPRSAVGFGEASRPEIVYCEICYQQEVV
jgi:hypothetical protein